MAIIKPLEKNETSSIAQDVYSTFEKETGNVPEWVKVMAHRPEILKEFTELFKAIMNKGKIQPYLKWKIAYVVSETLKCKFCVSVSISILKKLGASGELLKDIKNLENLPQNEQNILDLVKDITLDGHIDHPEILDKLKENLNEAEMVEIISVIGLFNYINRFNNAFTILPV